VAVGSSAVCVRACVRAFVRALVQVQEDLRAKLSEYVQERIIFSAEVVSKSVGERISDGDVIMVRAPCVRTPARPALPPQFSATSACLPTATATDIDHTLT
jgi:hypothetical protein